MKDIRNDTKPMNIRPTILPIGDHSGDGRWGTWKAALCTVGVCNGPRPAIIYLSFAFSVLNSHATVSDRWSTTNNEPGVDQPSIRHIICRL